MIKARTLVVSFSALLLLAGLAIVPAYAYAIEDGDENETSQTTTTSEETSEEKAEQLRQIKLERLKQAQEQYREKTKKLLEEARERQKKLDLAEDERESRCEERKSGLLTRSGKIATNAQRHLAFIDGFFAKAVAYQDREHLSVANYAELVAAATEAQTAATASVQALVDLKPAEVDCSDGSAAEQVAAFKAAAAQARTDLSAYKKSVKAILAALREAKEAVQEEGEE